VLSQWYRGLTLFTIKTTTMNTILKVLVHTREVISTSDGTEYMCHTIDDLKEKSIITDELHKEVYDYLGANKPEDANHESDKNFDNPAWWAYSRLYSREYNQLKLDWLDKQIAELQS
jgi:hypothetical protein